MGDKITCADNIHREAILATMTGVTETRALVAKALDEARGPTSCERGSLGCGVANVKDRNQPGQISIG